MNACNTETLTEPSKLVSPSRGNPKRPSAPSSLLKWTTRGCGLLAGLALLAPISRAQFAIQELVTGLNNTRAITFGPDGALYIAEAGSPFTPTASTPSIPTARGGTEYYGTNGAIVKYSNSTVTSVISNLPMLNNAGEITGVQGLAFNAAGDLFFTIGLGNNPASRTGALTSLGQLMRLPAGGSVAVSFADLSAFETLSNPAGLPFDSNPYHLLSFAGGFLAADAGGNDILQISSSGAISLKAVFPTPVGGPEFVPTTVVSTGGNLYVSQLTGAPFPPGGSTVYRLDGSTPVAIATGFTNVIDMAAGPDGMLYLIEYAHNGILSGNLSGELWEVNPFTGAKSLLLDHGLTAPSAITVGGNGTIFIANNGVTAGEGSIIAVTPVPEPAAYGAMAGAALIGLIIARRKRSQSTKAA